MLKKDSLKAEVVWEKNRGPKGRRWRWLLQERSWKWGKMLKMKGVGGDKCQGMPRDLDWRHPRPVTWSSCTIATDGIFCPTLPGQQQLHCWKVKSRLSEGNTGSGGKQVSKIIKQVKSSDLTSIEQTQMSRSTLRCCLFCLPATVWWDNLFTVL